VQSFSELFSEWRSADKAARDAEQALVDRWEQTGSLPVTDDQWKEAKRLRAFANYLMDAALAEMKNEDARRQATSRPGAHDSNAAGDSGEGESDEPSKE
jgi:hypothetical protein